MKAVLFLMFLFFSHSVFAATSGDGDLSFWKMFAFMIAGGIVLAIPFMIAGGIALAISRWKARRKEYAARLQQGVPCSGTEEPERKNETRFEIGIRGALLSAIPVAAIAFLIYRSSPPIYESTCDLTLCLTGSCGVAELDEACRSDFDKNYAEIVNTRISDWRSETTVNGTIRWYYSTYLPADGFVPADVLLTTLANSQIELLDNSRIIRMSIRSNNPRLASKLAWGYSESIANRLEEQNQDKCDTAVKEIHKDIEEKRSNVDRLSKKLLAARMEKDNVDTLRSSRETIRRDLSKISADIFLFATNDTQKTNEKAFEFGRAGVPPPTADGDGTPSLPSFAAASQKSGDQAGTLGHDLRDTLSSVEGKIDALLSVSKKLALAESKIAQLESELDLANRVLEKLILEESKIRNMVRARGEKVCIVNEAKTPLKPIPIFGSPLFGRIFGRAAALWLLFVACTFTYSPRRYRCCTGNLLAGEE